MRFTALIVVLTMICGIFGGNLSVSAIGANPLIGDVDEDGVLTVSDALRILRVCVGFAEYDENMLEVYDVWGDGDVDVKDALGILRSSIGVIGSFGRTGVKFIFEPNTMAPDSSSLRMSVIRKVPAKRVLPRVCSMPKASTSIATSIFARRVYTAVIT